MPSSNEESRKREVGDYDGFRNKQESLAKFEVRTAYVVRFFSSWKTRRQINKSQLK